MTFKIGDKVIMTADSGKGSLFMNYKNGDQHRGNVVFVYSDGGISAEFANGDRWSFEPDGVGSNYPGTSIRLAEEKVDPTPSQWIEGQIPDGETGLFLVWDKASGGHPDAFYVENKQGAWHKDYIYYIKLDILPPPPPVKEVEAYGFLQRFNEIQDMILKEVEDYDRLEDKARRFYSQPATAENLGKYIKIKGKEWGKWLFGEPEIVIDCYIQWHNRQCRGEKLLFAPAALEELGVK